MNVQYVLKNDMRIPETDKKRIADLDDMFINGDMPYLNGKALPKKIKDEIAHLYDKYITKVYENSNNGYDFLAIDKKQWPCKDRTNANYFLKVMFLNWAGRLPEVLTLDKLFNVLQGRTVAHIIYKLAYERVEK